MSDLRLPSLGFAALVLIEVLLNETKTKTTKIMCNINRVISAVCISPLLQDLGNEITAASLSNW